MQTNLKNRTQDPAVPTFTPVRKPVKNAMRCPNKACGGWRVSVIKTRTVKNGRAVIRRRLCESCRHEWETQEGQIEEVLE